MSRKVLLALLVASAAHAEPPLRASSNATVVNDCLMCHADELIEQQRLTAKQWQAVVKKMIGWGAPVEDAQVEPLTAWLAAQYGVSASPWAPPVVDVGRLATRFAPTSDRGFARGTVKQGEAFYAIACAACHGSDARGSATGMNLADRHILWRAHEFAQVVRVGRGRMPALPAASDAEIGSLLRYLRTR